MPDRAPHRRDSSKHISKEAQGRKFPRNAGEERSAEALTGDIPDHRVCLAWSMQRSLIFQLVLIPDSEITSSVVLVHSKSLEGRVWMAPQPGPANTVALSKYLRPVGAQFYSL